MLISVNVAVDLVVYLQRRSARYHRNPVKSNEWPKTDRAIGRAGCRHNKIDAFLAQPDAAYTDSGEQFSRRARCNVLQQAEPIRRSQRVTWSGDCKTLLRPRNGAAGRLGVEHSPLSI